MILNLNDTSPLYPESITPTEESEWIPNSNETMEISGIPELTTYYFWTIDNVGNISEPIIISTGEIFYSINDTSWYETFADAVADASTIDIDTIYVLKDVTDSSDGTVNKSVKLDANGYRLLRTAPIEVSIDGNLEVIGTGRIRTNRQDINSIIKRYFGISFLYIHIYSRKGCGTM